LLFPPKRFSRLDQVIDRRLLLADSVEKVVRGEHTKFLRAAGALDAFGRGGPRQPGAKALGGLPNLATKALLAKARYELVSARILPKRLFRLFQQNRPKPDMTARDSDLLAATHLALRKRPTSGALWCKKTQSVGAQWQGRAAAFLGQNMVDDTPEQLWQLIVRENLVLLTKTSNAGSLPPSSMMRTYVGKSLSGSSKTFGKGSVTRLPPADSGKPVDSFSCWPAQNP
jgi:hypothetical protein